MEIGLRRRIRLQMGPCGILLRTEPMFCEGGFAKQGGVRDTKFFAEHYDEGARRFWQLQRLN